MWPFGVFVKIAVHPEFVQEAFFAGMNGRFVHTDMSPSSRGQVINGSPLISSWQI